MARRVSRIATILSMVLLVIFVVLFLAGEKIDGQSNYFSFGNSFHVKIDARGIDSRIAFFNDTEYGPYQGSILELTNPKGKYPSSMKRREAFGDTCGFYYRYFQWTERKLWTLMVSVWYPIVFFAILPLMWLRSFIVSRRRGRGLRIGDNL